MGKLSYKLQRQTVHVDTVAGLPQSHCLVYAEWLSHAVRSTGLQTFLTVLNFHLCQGITGNDGFRTKSLLMKHMYTQFVVVRQFSYWQPLPALKQCQ